MAATQQQILEQARSSFATYFTTVFPRFEHPHHVELLIAELEALERGEIDRLALSLAPRFGKTTLAQLFCAWFLGKHPDRSVITAYSAELAEDSGRRLRLGRSHRKRLRGLARSPDLPHSRESGLELPDSTVDVEQRGTRS